MRYDSTKLDYLDLAAAARTLDATGSQTTIRVAVVADFATQHLVPLLRVLFARNGVRADVYEAGYDSIDVDCVLVEAGLDPILLRFKLAQARRRRFTSVTVERAAEVAENQDHRKRPSKGGGLSD